MSLADDANLLLIPTGYKAEKLYSIFPTSGVGDFDFARTTSATRVAKNGFITTVGTNVPRLNYDILDGEVVGCPHLLLEPSRTNLLPYSNDFSDSAWTKIQSGTGLIPVVTPNSLISPDGTLNASKVVFNTGSGVSSSDLSFLEDTVSATSGISINQSVYLKGENGGETILIRGAAGGSYTTLTLTNKWVRYNSTEISGASSSSWSIGLRQGLGGVVINSTATIYIYGAQFEVGSYPTSYIPTNGEVNGVTRAAETCNGAGNAATFNDSEGVLMAEISALADTVTTYNSIGLGNNSAFNRIGLGFKSPNTVYVYKHDGSNSWLAFETIDINSFNKVALSYKTNDNHFWVNGFKLASNTTIEDVSNISELDFEASYGGEKFYGKTKQIQYHSTALSDSDLEKLTSWTSFEDMAQSQLYTIQ